MELLSVLIHGNFSAFASYAGLGATGLPIVVIYALVHTSLSEELLFRGFLLKRMSNKFGFIAGNISQAILFGLLHGAMFIGYAEIVKAIIIILSVICFQECCRFFDFIDVHCFQYIIML